MQEEDIRRIVYKAHNDLKRQSAVCPDVVQGRGRVGAVVGRHDSEVVLCDGLTIEHLDDRDAAVVLVHAELLRVFCQQIPKWKSQLVL